MRKDKSRPAMARSKKARLNQKWVIHVHSLLNLLQKQSKDTQPANNAAAIYPVNVSSIAAESRKPQRLVFGITSSTMAAASASGRSTANVYPSQFGKSCLSMPFTNTR